MPVLKKLAPRPRRRNFHSMTKEGRRHYEIHKRSTFDTPALMPMGCASALGLLGLGLEACHLAKVVRIAGPAFAFVCCGTCPPRGHSVACVG
eukprot:COSAG06_NODE_541_length_14471_cov_35.139229_5_plen_92_part_00